MIGVEIWILSSNVDTKCLMPVTIKEEVKTPWERIRSNVNAI